MTALGRFSMDSHSTDLLMLYSVPWKVLLAVRNIKSKYRGLVVINYVDLISTGQHS